MERSATATSDPVDPLAGCSSFPLLPFSFNRPPIDNLNPNFDTHSHFKAMALRSPDKLLMQAKTILDDSTETDKTSAMVTENMPDKVSSLSDKNPQERRPGLGLKRAKFSLKPRPSQPDVVSEPTFDAAKYKDPVEFFAAMERYENAKKEMQRLKGQPVPVLNFNPNLQHLSPRRRRPSLFGKSATYKHRSYSSKMVDDNGEVSQSSQKTSEKHIASPTCQDALPETDIVNNSQHTEVSDLTRGTTSEQDEFDELLSHDYGGLDDAGVLDILKGKLQIKLKDVDKPALPDSLYVPRRESETCDALSKMTVDIARLKRIRKSFGSQHLSLSSQHRSQVAPVQSKSPLASVSLLNKYLSKLSPMKDPFSALDIDSPPVRILSLKTVHGAQPDNLDTRKDLYESGTSLMHVDENSAAAINPPVMEKNITAELEEQLDVVSQLDHDAARKDVLECGISATHGEETIPLSSVFSPSLERNNISSTSEPKECFRGAAQSAQVAEEKDMCDFSKSHAHREQSVAGAGEDLLVFDARGVDPSSENMELHNEVSVEYHSAELELNIEGCSTDKSNVHGGKDLQECGTSTTHGEETASVSSVFSPSLEVSAEYDSVQLELNIEGCSTEKSNVHEVEESTISKIWNTDDIDIEEPNKEASEPSKRKLENRRKSKVAENTSVETVKKGGKEKTQTDLPLSENATNRKRKAQEAARASKRKLMSRRNSLYAAGTVIEEGRRRSTRIKMRPLEYWKGERFLYGRVHDSLMTVIGVKYASPSKEAAENRRFNVKSFVSDKYKELVELAALH